MATIDLDLEFLIPCYRRIDTAVQAVESILDQMHLLPLGVQVRIRLQDDASPGMSDAEFAARTAHLPAIVTCKRNAENMGMSANIHALVSSSTADFCTILTDDDMLQPGVLDQIAADFLDLRNQHGCWDIAALFVPRHSYLEDGSLLCIECQPFNQHSIIEPSPASSMAYARNGFILTGLFLKPNAVPYQLWETHIDNAFFPVLYFGGLLQKNPVAFRDRHWFHHTVLNRCHWERWGASDVERQARLCHDFLEAIQILRSQNLAYSHCGKERKRIRYHAKCAYRGEINGYSQYLNLQTLIGTAPRTLWLQPEFLHAFTPFLLRSLSTVLRKKVRWILSQTLMSSKITQ